MNLIIATNNAHKVEEIKSKLPKHITVQSLAESNIKEDIPEEQDTLEGNALQKARYIYDKYKKDCFADDTGLEIDALEGAPGVYSARYAGENCSFNDNVQKVLKEMQSKHNRNARFRTVIALIIKGNEFLFEGEVMGQINKTQTGTKGFGYDPIFQPNGYSQSFAEMSLEQKNNISHRGIAVTKLIDFLTTLK